MIQVRIYSRAIYHTYILEIVCVSLVVGGSELFVNNFIKCWNFMLSFAQTAALRNCNIKSFPEPERKKLFITLDINRLIQ